MPIRIRMRGFAGTTALIAASALALAGCGGDTGTQGTDDRPAAVTATPSSGSPTPEAPPATETSTPTPTPTPVTLPDHTGDRVGTAIRAAEKAGLGYTVRLEGTGKRASSWGSGEKVCEQTDGSDGVTFTVPRDGRDCDGRLLHTPKPTPTPEPPQTRDTGGSGGTGSGGGTGTCELTSPAGNCYADGQFCAKKHRGLSTHGRGGEYLTCALDSGGIWRWSDGVAG